MEVGGLQRLQLKPTKWILWFSNFFFVNIINTIIVGPTIMLDKREYFLLIILIFNF